jgi:hypothetical protein
MPWALFRCRDVCASTSFRTADRRPSWSARRSKRNLIALAARVHRFAAPPRFIASLVFTTPAHVTLRHALCPLAKRNGTGPRLRPVVRLMHAQAGAARPQKCEAPTPKIPMMPMMIR